MGASSSTGETETGGSTGSTGPESACGDGVLDPDEECDDGNEAAEDGCLACVIPRSCAHVLELATDAESGVYKVDPMGSGDPWEVTCDMDLDGGGWTGFAVQDTCNGHLESEVISLKAAEIFAIDEECRPSAEYLDGGDYNYTWDISFPPGYSAFFLRGYEVQGLGDVELKFQQVVWTQASDFPNGALSLGNTYEDGPITNWAADGGMTSSFIDGQILPYPVQEVPFDLGVESDALRIGWGEIGINNEGLYPWWSGQIFVR